MKIKKALNKLFSHNEIIALWCETNKGFKVLLWRGEAWKLSEEYKNLRISRIFGTIPETITQADTINILIKAKPIPVACTTCIKRSTMECPNSKECWSVYERPHWEWDVSMWNERIGGSK